MEITCIACKGAGHWWEKATGESRWRKVNEGLELDEDGNLVHPCSKLVTCETCGGSGKATQGVVWGEVKCPYVLYCTDYGRPCETCIHRKEMSYHVKDHGGGMNSGYERNLHKTV